MSAFRADAPFSPVYHRRTVFSWALYDFANSIYPAVMTTAVFPIFYSGYVVGDLAGEGGGDAWWGLAVSTSALLIALSAPLLGAVADGAGVRKRLMAIFVGICLVGVLAMTTLSPGMIVAGFCFFVIANVGYEGSLIFYNAYLPEIAPVERRGFVSGLGFGVGYLGSALGLVLVLPFAQDRTELVWPIVAAFFLLFSIPTFRNLPADRAGGIGIGRAAVGGIVRLRKTIALVRRLPNLRRFLISYFFYIDGILTLIVMAGVIAVETFGFNQVQTIELFLIVQFSALVGSFALARPTDRFGPKPVLRFVLIWWIGIGVAGYFVQSSALFYGLALAGGLGLGSAQAASRTFMASLIPKGKEAEMFGFYALCGKTSSVLGPALFGWLTVQFAGNQRPGFLLLTGFFLVGGFLLRFVKDPRVEAVGV